MSEFCIIVTLMISLILWYRLHKCFVGIKIRDIILFTIYQNTIIPIFEYAIPEYNTFHYQWVFFGEFGFAKKAVTWTDQYHDKDIRGQIAKLICIHFRGFISNLFPFLYLITIVMV